MDAYEKLLAVFPERLRGALSRFSSRKSVCEIRLRKNAPLSLTLYSGNAAIDKSGNSCGMEEAITATKEEISETVSAFCRGSLYRYLPDLKEGFLVGEGGVRMGIVFDGSEIGFSPYSGSVSSLNFRIPRFVPGAAKEIESFFRSEGIRSTLIVSLPGAGKTTLMRDLALSLSTGKICEPKRVAVIDERGELFPDTLVPKGLCDLFVGYKKAKGIEIATRLLNPEIILCDEIGTSDDADALLSAQAGGSVFLATAHAASKEAVLAKPNLKKLVEAGLFETLAVLERAPGNTFSSRILFCRLP